MEVMRKKGCEARQSTIARLAANKGFEHPPDTRLQVRSVFAEKRGSVGLAGLPDPYIQCGIGWRFADAPKQRPWGLVLADSDGISPVLPIEDGLLGKVSGLANCCAKQRNPTIVQ